MILENVNSSCLDCVGYDKDEAILGIRFNSGYVYAYYNVPESEYDELMNADSHGRYYNFFIKGKYNCERVA
ncbi:MAG: KTSC domain-containing protein [Defluviitaleaceae bacterium]|nr:KTSC domain-containing protein [Defluviitaleaceae bacterium]